MGSVMGELAAAGSGGGGGGGGWWFGAIGIIAIFTFIAWRISTGDSPYEDYASTDDLVPKEHQLDPRTGRRRSG